ncbi:thiamine phosphate synthase [Aetokthonos hydrillicola Thurmond2011]|jgi:thiamine-phosphate pyrophosphorylase|uniref:Thiamine-phosphate synthase n=1 Tax=Aetokthonos hydrillicola Thurmond2011 TaxID=2712845 RepID=A0AAP5I9J9_9CYAN|nr:thiamine phosphate synthase [Aetokthonos hydrillicola]MBO3461821.1 thiamine phosphate synthase [Aetokthonos hydrillicola CCALA 1050]MBW4589966.1 thiamine phosphate synthase [Aetokthonos hydrillicola CCALA 1050]MDR9895708.1 thiamine phosphate synthase [Aetokthonos hydrillicola Thurmond2011]
MKGAGCYDESTNGVVVMVEPNSQTEQIKQVVYRILDANLDRAREGLRIIEEWCRFGLNNAHLASQCKKERQEIANWHTAQIRATRDTLNDPGTDLTHPQEEERNSIKSLLQANFCRVQEALRVVEEYSKLYNPNMGKVFKQMRYRIYTLETDLMGQERHQVLLRSRLYLVTSPHEKLLEIVEAALKGGLTLLQYRNKTADDSFHLEQAKKLRQLCHLYGAIFIINDRVDVALAVDADGVHLGQQDMPIAIARQLLGPQRIIGKSTTNSEEMQRAITEGADYIGVGPVYETPTKAGKPAAGLEYVSYAAKNSPIPWFAIGGIDPNNINEVIDAGANRVAVVRSLMQAEQPTLVTQYFLSQLNRIQPEFKNSHV